MNIDGESGKCQMKWKIHNKTKMRSILHNLHPDLIRIIYQKSRVHQQEYGGDEDITIIG